LPDEEELRALDHKLKQLKLDYDRYFLGTRPREPVVLRGEVDKLVAIYSNQAITNSGLRFRFSSICSRYQALKRQWCEIVRQIESGDVASARKIHQDLSPLFAALFCTTSPIPLKAGLEMAGLPGGPLRPPLFAATDDERETVRRALADAGVL